MIKKWIHLYQNERGISLLELLLVVGALSLISVGVVEMSRTWAESEKSLSAARHLRIVHNAAESYIQDNFEGILTEMAGNGGVLEIPINDAGGSVYYLKDGGTYLPVNFPINNSYRQTLTVLVRDATDGGPVDKIEAVVVSTGRAVLLDNILSTARAAGAFAGIASGIDVGSYNTANFSGIYNSWSAAMGDYAALTWDETNLPIAQDSGHLAAFIEMTQEDILNDYMYRVEISGNDDANRMMTNLNMNNNNLFNTGRLTADYVNVTGDMVLNQSVNVTGGMVAAGSVTTTGGLFVEESINLGSLIVEGDMAAATLNVTGTVTGDGANTDVTSQTLEVGGTLGTQDFTARQINFDNAGSRQIMSNSSPVRISEITDVETVTTGALGVNSLNANTVNVTGDFTATGAVDIDGNAIFNGTVSGNNAFNTAIGTLNSCQTVQDGVCQ